MNARTRLLVLPAIAALSAAAVAQIDSATPLAWRWVHSTAVAPSGEPLFDGDMIYIAVGNRLFGIDSQSGNERWKFPQLEPILGDFQGSPVIIDGVVVGGSTNRQIFGVDAKTGERKWIYQIIEKAMMGQPVAAGKLFVFALNDNTLMAIDPKTGEPAWTAPYKVDGGINGQMVSHGDDVIVATTDNRMISISAVSQKPNWTARFGNIPPGVKPTVFGDVLYVNSGSYLVAVNALRGTARWQVDLRETLNFGPGVSANGVAAATRDGKLYFFDLNGRRALREVIDLGSAPVTAPAAVGDKFVVPTANGSLNLIDPKDGKILWSYVVRPIGKFKQTPESKPVFSAGGVIDTRILSVPAAGSPVLRGTTMFAFMRDGSLLAFDKHLGVDLTAPTVDMLWPTPGAQVSGMPPLELIFKIDDEATGVDLKTLKILLDGEPLKFDVGRDLVAVARIAHSGEKINKPLTDGRRKIEIVVSDWMGNESRKTYSLTVDNQLPPLVRANSGGAKPGTGKPSGGGKNSGPGSG